MALWSTLRGNEEDFNYCVEEAKEDLLGFGLESFKKFYNENQGKDEDCGCLYRYILRDDDDDFALVMGKVDDLNNIGIKIAKQSTLSGMQCDYDWDWEDIKCNEEGDYFDLSEVPSSAEEIEPIVKNFYDKLEEYFTYYVKYN